MDLQVSETRLHGYSIPAARIGWLAVAGFAVLLFVAALPARFEQLGLTTPFGNIDFVQLAAYESGLLQQQGWSPRAYAFYFVAIESLFALIFIAVGLWIFIRKSDDWLGMFISLTLILFGVMLPPPLRAVDTPSSGLEFGVHLIQVLGYFSFFTFLYVFPDGNFVPRWTRPLPVLFALWGVAWLGLPNANPFNWELPFALLAFLVLFASGVVAQIYRYARGSNPMQRQQTKWVVSGFAAAALGTLLFLSPLLFSPPLREPGLTRVYYHMIGIAFFAGANALIPITIDFAIRRHRLWEIDPIINRALVYGTLTAFLAGLYTAAINLSQRLFIALTGEKSDAAIVFTTLVVASAFTPVRTKLQTVVDARLKEHRNAADRLNAFGRQVQAVVQVIDAREITRRLLDEAVTAFEAECGAAYMIRDGQRQLVHVCGVWRDDAQLTVPMQSDTVLVGSLALGARKGGGEYTAQDRDALQQTADWVVRAISLIEDRKMRNAV